jgi:hypothetical protein
MKLTSLSAALLAGLLLTGMARADEPPPPFEGRLTGVFEGSRQVSIDDLTYSLSSTVVVEDLAGKPVALRQGLTGTMVRATVAPPEEGRSGPSPILNLTILFD